MQEGVAAAKLGMKVAHRLGHEVRPRQHMDRQALGRGQQLAARRDDTGREVAATVEDARTPRSQ